VRDRRIDPPSPLSMSEETSSSHPSASSAEGLSHAWRALRHRNFRLFFTGQSISLIGSWMTNVATAWLVYRLTGSALLLGTVGFCGQIPVFFLAPFAGVWIERLDRRTVLLCTQAIFMAQSLLLAALTLSGHITMPLVILLSVVGGIANAVDMPARQSFMIKMVNNRDDLSNAIALNSSMVNMARLIGPTVAGLLIAITSEGWCFLIDGISYIAVLASLLAMRIDDSVHAQKKTSALTELREGWNYVTGFVPIRTIFVLFTVCSLMGMPFVVLMPVFAAQVLHGGPHTLGILMGAMGIGTLTSAISLAVRKSVRGLVTILPIAAIVFGLGLIGFGLSRWLWLSMLTVMIAGLGMMQGLAASNTVMQTLVPEEMRSRLMSYYTMAFIGMAPFGSLLAGTMAHRLGTPLTVILNGAAVIVGALWFFTQLHEVHRQVRPIYQRLGIIPADKAAKLQNR